MIKVMIVDDMPVDREYLRNFIDWEAYGFEACCEARDGKEALELFEQYQPDIVLTDIMMPYMDGIELSEHLLKENPEVSIILITGNSEFNYARRALKLGVCDYIVKPFEKEELIVALLKLQDNINRVLELKNEKDELLAERREQQLRHLIYTKNDTDIALSTGTEVFQFHDFLVVTVRIDIYENKFSPEEILNWKQILSGMLKNMIHIQGKHEVFHDFEGNIICILCFEDHESMETYGGYEFEDICNLAKDHIGITISVGISDYCRSPYKLREAYYQTLQALSGSYSNRSAKVFDYKKMLLETMKEFYSFDLIEEINKSLDSQNYPGIEQLIQEELERIKEYENIEFSSMIYMSLLSILFSYIAKLGRNMDDIFGKGFHPYSIINNENSYEKKRHFICGCYEKAIQYQLEHQDSKSHQIARKARVYIETYYENPDLSIMDISRELYVNQTYLRRMFKEEYQMTISDYMTKYRMEMAKDMILKENSKLSYISTKVGYNDPSYFSKCFKKYFGHLPSNVINRQ